MIRFISFLLGHPYEPCKSCETLKEQLIFEREEKKRLTDILISIVSPKVMEAQQPIEINPVMQTSALFSRRRAALEAKDREDARIKKNSTNLGKPDDRIEELEKELGVSETVGG